jgi:ferredoxin
MDEQPDLIGIAGPVYHLRELAVMSRFITQTLPSLPSRPRAFAWATYCGVSTGYALLRMSRALTRAGFPVIGAGKAVAPHFWDNRPHDVPSSDVKTVLNGFAGALMERFHTGYSWETWENDLSFQKPVIRRVFGIMPLIGRLRFQRLVVHPRECTSCGLCVRECPVSALALSPKPVRDKKACVHCYHCAAVCKTGGITTRFDRLDDTVRTNQRIAGFEYPQNSYY